VGLIHLWSSVHPSGIRRELVPSVLSAFATLIVILYSVFFFSKEGSVSYQSARAPEPVFDKTEGDSCLLVPLTLLS